MRHRSLGPDRVETSAATGCSQKGASAKEFHLSLVRLFAAFALCFLPLAATAGDDNRFLVESPSPGTGRETGSCAAPAAAIARITGLAGLDTYVARAAPASSAGHVTPDGSFGLFGNGAPLDLAADHMVTQDRAAAEICERLNAGETGVELQEKLAAAIARDALWWPVRTDVGETVYVTAAHVSVEQEPPEGAPLGYAIFGPRYPTVRILSLSGQDSAEARVVAEPVTHEQVDLCHGLYRSPLFLHLAMGEPLDEPIVNGIWRGCNAAEGMFPPDYTWEVVADCPAMVLKESDGDVALSPEDLLLVGSAALSGLPERFMVLCPETVEAALRHLCESGDGGCGMAAELASGCAPDEETIFSCRIRGQERVASFCVGETSATYLFGPPDAEPEMRLSVPVADVVRHDDDFEGSFARVANASHSYEVWSSPDRDDAGVRVFATPDVSAGAAPIAALVCDPDWQTSSFYILD